MSQNPGGGAANLASSAAVYGFLGTPPQWRRHSKLVWKQGACLLLEEALAPAVVATVYRLGPNYLGTLQAPFINGTAGRGTAGALYQWYGLGEGLQAPFINGTAG